MGCLSAMVKSHYFAIILFQAVLIILFGIFTEYDDAANPAIKDGKPKEMDVSYPMFQDIHVMIFIGFGFLMTFLKRYGYSAVGFNLMLAALMIQCAIFCRGMFESHGRTIKIGMKSLMGADIAAASVLISMGAVLGQTSCLQLLIMGIIEIIIFSANEYLIIEVLEIVDVGGSIAVHTFGAYFGLAVSYILRPRPKDLDANKLEGASYNSDISAMIGTVFLWIFWPSFNGGLVTGDEQYRAIINTYLSLAACTVTAFIISAMTSHEKKFDMVHVQNSTLAGGVAVGSICNMIIHPYGAMLAGAAAGVISVVGYKYLSPALTRVLGFKDTCGVHNLHGMPGVFSGLLSGLIAYLATDTAYSTSLSSVFPALKPHLNSTSTPEHPAFIDPRSIQDQAGYQILGLVITLVTSIVTGLVTGIILKTTLLYRFDAEDKYDDNLQWELPEPDQCVSSEEGQDKSTNQQSERSKV